MLNQETINKLKNMKLTGMVDALQQQDSTSSYQELGFDERLALLVDWEYNRRQHGRQQSLISSARFQNSTACVENIKYHDDRQLDRNFVRSSLRAISSHM